MEPEKVVDFKPPSDTVCCVCDGKSIDHEQENIPILPTSSGLNQPNSEQHDTAKLNRSGLVAAGRVGEASLGHTEMTAASSTAAAAGEIPTSLEGGWMNYSKTIFQIRHNVRQFSLQQRWR